MKLFCKLLPGACSEIAICTGTAAVSRGRSKSWPSNPLCGSRAPWQGRRHPGLPRAPRLSSEPRPGQRCLRCSLTRPPRPPWGRSLAAAVAGGSGASRSIRASPAALQGTSNSKTCWHSLTASCHHPKPSCRAAFLLTNTPESSLRFSAISQMPLSPAGTVPVPAPASWAASLSHHPDPLPRGSRAGQAAAGTAARPGSRGLKPRAKP